MQVRRLGTTALLLFVCLARSDPRELQWQCDRNVFAQKVYDAASAFSPPVTDKFTKHAFETIYGMFLLPLRFARIRPRILEINLGCDSGASRVWRELLPRAELFTATQDGPCPSERSWADGRRFDVIIDDNYRADDQLADSFDKLWPLVKPGGVFILENPAGVAVERIKSWTVNSSRLTGARTKIATRCLHRCFSYSASSRGAPSASNFWTAPRESCTRSPKTRLPHGTIHTAATKLRS